MAMRRRLKVAVNLTSARKPKTEPGENSTSEQVKIKVEPTETTQTQNEAQSVKPVDTSKLIPTKVEPQPEQTSDKNAFKCPPKVEYNRSNSHHNSLQNTDDIQHLEIDDGVQVMQLDLQKTNNMLPMSSPLKSQRHRIKPTPVFGQRRNSFVGAPSSPLPHEDVNELGSPLPRRERHFSGSQSLASIVNSPSPKSIGRIRTESTSSLRRERHYSGSQSLGGATPNFTPTKSVGRIRTESTCSVISDSHISLTSKSRKTDEHGSHRTNLRREFEARFSSGIPDKASLKMSDLIYYNPVTNPMEQKSKVMEIKSETKKEEPDTEEVEENNNNDSLTMPVPQLKLNAKGELILDDKSLEIETTAEQEARKVLAKSSLIFLDENTGMNGFYKRHKRTRDWAPDETIRFYRCLQTIGTDFSMMCQLFPKRTRRDLKLKFKKEERCNAALINKAILHPNSFNIDDLKNQFEIEDREREEEEKEREKEKASRKKDYKKPNGKRSKSARALTNAEDVYNLCEGMDLNDSECHPLNKKPKPANTTKDKKKNDNGGNGDGDIQKKVARKPRRNNVERKERSNPNRETVKIEPDQNLITPDVQNHFNTDDVQNEGEDFLKQTNDASNSQKFYYMDECEEESRTFVDLDNGNLTFVRDEEEDAQHKYDAMDQRATDLSNNLQYYEEVADSFAKEQNEDDTPADDLLIDPTELYRLEENDNDSQRRNWGFNVERILEDIASGKLQVVSSIDPDTADAPVNEVYMLDPGTGDLCDDPLNLPSELVEGILSIMM